MLKNSRNSLKSPINRSNLIKRNTKNSLLIRENHHNVPDNVFKLVEELRSQATPKHTKVHIRQRLVEIGFFIKEQLDFFDKS